MHIRHWPQADLGVYRPLRDPFFQLLIAPPLALGAVVGICRLLFFAH